VPTTQDMLRVKMEETPRYEGAATTTPYRISTTAVDLPIQTFRLSPGVGHIDRGDEVRGIEGAYEQLVEGYEVDGNLAMRAYLNSATWFLTIAGWVGTYTLGNGIITDPDGIIIPTGAHRWVFLKRGGITAKTAQFEACYVDEGVFIKGQGCGISNWTLNASGDFTADLLGLVFANQADPNYTPSYDAASIPHVRRGDLSLTWLAGSGTTDDFSVAVTNPLTRRRTMGITPASYYPDKHEHGDEKVRLTGTVPKSTLADADVDALLAGTTFAGKARWITPKVIGATSYKYSMWIEMPACQLVGGTLDELANRRRFGASYDFWAAWDSIAGYDVKITLVNAVTSAALETLV
jgi:hypothetical protein